MRFRKECWFDPGLGYHFQKRIDFSRLCPARASEFSNGLTPPTNSRNFACAPPSITGLSFARCGGLD
ncbi:hypothetical protein AGR7C_Lc80198 [Agrobacterium deltaense Zutra 3/1]|uniref:Uncharacterized protein n=1 Tax=Agrobacterium deltaense Zutra 3/1 TaxID=1183427 RepID=A0A1S7RZQ6_9HYPH|nr:hypothetical protein AGR7C_Lc80198 [Agrobacterium deltaense Zutra 3/1]